MDKTFGEVRFEKLPRTRIAKHAIFSASPEGDVVSYMEDWAKKSGLFDIEGYTPRKFGWDVSVDEETKKANPELRGYGYCMTLPEDFTPKHGGVEITYIEADEYAVFRIVDPFSDPFAKIPGGWQELWNFVQNSEYKTRSWEGRYAFEEVTESGGVVHMDIYLPIN